VAIPFFGAIGWEGLSFFFELNYALGQEVCVVMLLKV
jgi:hypothetical protein